MPYMGEFFNEKLKVPTEFFNPLQNVTVSKSAPTQEVTRSAHLLGEVVGLALRSVTTCAMQLNLLPASVVRRQDNTLGGKLERQAKGRGACRGRALVSATAKLLRSARPSACRGEARWR